MKYHVGRVLPKEQLIEKLKALPGIWAEPHVHERLWPHLVKYADDEKESRGLVVMAELAVADYTHGLKSPQAPGGAALMRFLLEKELHVLIPALSGDEKLVKEALAFLEEVRAEVASTPVISVPVPAPMIQGNVSEASLMSVKDLLGKNPMEGQLFSPVHDEALVEMPKVSRRWGSKEPNFQQLPRPKKT